MNKIFRTILSLLIMLTNLDVRILFAQVVISYTPVTLTAPAATNLSLVTPSIFEKEKIIDLSNLFFSFSKIDFVVLSRPSNKFDGLYSSSVNSISEIRNTRRPSAYGIIRADLANTSVAYLWRQRFSSGTRLNHVRSDEHLVEALPVGRSLRLRPGRRTSVKNSGSAFAAAAFNRFTYNDRSELNESARYLGTDINILTSPVTAEYRSFVYDPIGNRTNITVAANNGTYSANNLNQYSTENVAGGGTNTFTYDDDGNLTAISGNRNVTYTYNAENQLITAAPTAPALNDKKMDLVYDYQGRRVQKIVSNWTGVAWVALTTKRFVYDGWNVLEEQTVAGTSKYYVWGLDLSQSLQGAGGIGGLLTKVEGALTHHYLYDGNGNVGQLVNATTASLDAQYEYDPYGNSILATGSQAAGNPYRFSTKYLDSEYNHYYYIKRYYDPLTGRWLSRDPIGEYGGLNLYGFVKNIPVSLYDVLGLTDPELGVVFSVELDWNPRKKIPTIRGISFAGSASQGSCDDVKLKGDVNVRVYSTGLGTSVTGNGDIAYDLTGSVSAIIGNGSAGSTPTYTLNYNTKSALDNSFRNSFTYGHSWNYNSGVGGTSVGFLGFRSDNFYAHYNNDASEFPTYGGSDTAWTAGAIAGMYVGGGQTAEMGYQDFTGRYINRSNTFIKNGITYYKQTRDQVELNQAEWYFRYGGEQGSVTAHIESPGWLNMQHVIHNIRGLSHFEYLGEDDNDFRFSFSFEGELKAKGGK